MTCVQTNAHARLVRDKVYDLSQFGEFPTNSITLTAHILYNYSKNTYK